MKLTIHSLTKVMLTALIVLSVFQPNLVKAQDTIEDEVQQESVVTEISEVTPTPTATIEVEETIPTETTMPQISEKPETTPTVEIVDAQEVIASPLPTSTPISTPSPFMATSKQSEPNISITSNIENVKATITEKDITTEIDRNNEGKFSTYCATACDVTLESQDATLMNVKQNSTEIYKVENDFQNKITLQFDNSASQNAEVQFGYQLTITTHYLPNQGTMVDKNGKILWTQGETVEAMNNWQLESNSITYVLSPKTSFEAVPQAAESGNYPLRLLDYSGYTCSANLKPNLVVRRAAAGATGSDDPQVWYEQSQAANVFSNGVRYYGIKEMPAGNATLDYAYNYTQKSFFVGLSFEQEDGNYVMEKFNGLQGHPTLSSYHHKEFVADGKQEFYFNPRVEIYDDKIAYPDGTSSEDYLLSQAYLTADSNYLDNVYYVGWSEKDKEVARTNMKNVTGLQIDNQGIVSGNLLHRLVTRNYVMTYYYRLNRELVFNINDGTTNETKAQQAFHNDVIQLNDNTFKREGYQLTGWNTAADKSGTEYAANAKFTMPAVKSITLYAIWTPTATPTPTVTPTTAPTDPQPENPGCPVGTEWNEARQECLVPTVYIPPVNPQPQPLQPVQPEQEVIVDDNTPQQNGEPKATATPKTEEEKIADETTPEQGSRGSWALINLVSSLLGLVIALMLLISKHEKEDDEENTENKKTMKRNRMYKLISTVAALVSIILFVLTENLRLPMVLVDQYTLMMVVFLVINIVALYFGRVWHEDEEEESEA